jgi:hypothetical protein
LSSTSGREVSVLQHQQDEAPWWSRDTDEGGEVKLESNGGDPRLLSLGLSGGSALTGGLDGVEGRDHVGWSNSGSRGGGSYRDSCLLLRLDLYAGDGRDQGAWSDLTCTLAMVATRGPGATVMTAEATTTTPVAVGRSAMG